MEKCADCWNFERMKYPLMIRAIEGKCRKGMFIGQTYNGENYERCERLFIKRQNKDVKSMKIKNKEINTWAELDKEKERRRDNLVEMQTNVERGYDNLYNWEAAVATRLREKIGDRRSKD